MHPTPNTDTVTALHKRLMTRARRLGMAAGDAEDMAQETLLRLIERMARSNLDAPEHYAMIVLQNLARARWRSRAQQGIPAPQDDLAEASTPPVGDSRLSLATLQRAISTLPEAQQQVMQLVVQGEDSPQAIAHRLGLPVGTVMSRLARARAHLRTRVGLAPNTPVAELL